MGDIDLATAWDFPSATQQSVPSEDRDFSRPKESYFAGTYPGNDIANADVPIINVPTVNEKDKSKDQIFSPAIKEFQLFFSKSNQLIGAPYQGPIDGIVNDALVAAAKKVESIISKALNNSGAHGLIWNDKTKSFNTSTTDVSEALVLLVKHTPEITEKKAYSVSDRKMLLSRMNKKYES